RLVEQPFTVGYFGHLTSAWFDWDLIIQLAEKRTEWIIELIGPGLPPRSIPDNIHLTGRLPHAELADHAAHWNVAIIPFQEGDLSRAVDPIKVYEYLALGKPVVVTGMPHLSQMPYVYPAQSADEFEEMILEASGMTLDEQVIARFLSENNWDQRIKVILQEISPSFQLFAGGSGNSTGDQP
ncbi:MAG: glycosyltransferase, partial [Longilinea sp.]|nr:glycosyltransferase [Longilinea sp.]